MIPSATKAALDFDDHAENRAEIGFPCGFPVTKSLISHCESEMHGPEALIWTRASTAKGRERPHLFARPAARKATRGRPRPFLSCNALCTRPRWMSTAASKYKLSRTVHRSPRNIVQVGRAFFLCRILPTSCPIVEIEGDFSPRTPTPLSKNRRAGGRPFQILLLTIANGWIIPLHYVTVE